jgi:asparagine synthase (glutamine-hydrolysing)
MALMWNPVSPELSAVASDLERKLKATAPTWSRVLECQGVRVMVADRSACFGAHLLCDDAGVVVGEVFVRPKETDSEAPAYDAKFNRFETHQALKSQGRSLASRYWGNFAAFIVDNGQLGEFDSRGGRRANYIFKDPSGTLPCHFTEHRGVRLVFSCLEDCRQIGLSFPVNWAFVRTRAVNGFFDTDIPSLLGVSTVHRGECVRFDASGKFVSRARYWHPSNFEGATELITDPAMAAKIMRATVRSCVHSMAGHHVSVLAQTSGGLDSSIVLGLLGDSPSKLQITCYTDYAPESVCDERRWARYAVARGAHRHIELCRDPKAVVYKDVPPLAPSTVPASYFTHSQRGPVDRAMAAQFGATAIFTGEGGDSTFCATTYSYAADHCFRRRGLNIQTLRIALLVAARRDRTVWQVLAKAVGREVFGGGRAEERRRRASFNRLVSPLAKAEVEQRQEGATWLSAGGRLSQETQLRLGTLGFPPVFYDLSTSARGEAPYVASPLCAQPVLEMCLRIPVDIHFDGGRTRGMARRAFADVVPAPISRRQWKDRPLLYFQDVIQRNLPFMRDHLLNGSLVKQGILDRAAMELALKNGPTVSSALSGEILSHLDLELWIRDSA